MRDVREMVIRDRSRPSGIIWGTRLNECKDFPGQYGGLARPPFLVHLPKRLPKPAPDLLVRGFVGGSDATRVVFRAIDAFGNQRRYGSGQVALTLSGPAMLLGDNPFEFGRYGGLGAVWIRSLAGQQGTITLTASHPRLGRAEVQVRSVAVTNTSELG